MSGEDRTAVVDLGSNSFRLVVYEASRQGWWRRTDELHDVVRVAAGMQASDRLASERMEVALRTLELYAHFCRAEGIDREHTTAVATSAIREAANRDEFLARARERSGLDVEVLSPEREGWYAYLAAVNSTTLTDGLVLDLGGGSLQIVAVAERQPARLRSWRLGAVAMTERFVSDPLPARSHLDALRAHTREQVGGFASGSRRIVGMGGSLRCLATAAQRAAGHPGFGVQGFLLERAALQALIAELSRRAPAERAEIPGIKPERADTALAAALTIDAVLSLTDADGIELTEAGLREGVFLERHLGADGPRVADVRRAAVENLAARYPTDPRHVRHTARLALELFDELARIGLHRGDDAERELLWAAAMLHDIGMTIDYDDHHKHSRYLILNVGLPGHTPREVALIALIARYHRKGRPSLGCHAALAQEDDQRLLERCAAIVRLAERLERAHDQTIRGVRLERSDDGTTLILDSSEDLRLARWTASRDGGLFERVFGGPLRMA